MILLILLIALIKCVSCLFDHCSSDGNECLSFTNQLSHCLPNEYLELNLNTSCCPQCRGGLSYGNNNCSNEKQCAPGLVCVDGVCELDRETCFYTYHLKHLQNLPQCDLNGSFAAKQCKGDMVSGRCFCHSENGQRIFGSDWRKNTDNMTCACSRYRHKLEKAGRLDVTLHCSENGNYEVLQCDSGICWCADEKTGAVLHGTRVLPESAWQYLPCYNYLLMGNQYLRQCESAAYAQRLIRKKLALRGTIDVSFNNIQCDYDGSFGTYNILNGIASCTWRDGANIGSFQVNANSISGMNCYCARDLKMYESTGVGFPLSCAGNGNYERIQGINGRIFCVDQDGFAVTDYFNTVVGLDCDKYFYYAA